MLTTHSIKSHENITLSDGEKLRVENITIAFILETSESDHRPEATARDFAQALENTYAAWILTNDSKAGDIIRPFLSLEGDKIPRIDSDTHREMMLEITGYPSIWSYPDDCVQQLRREWETHTLTYIKTTARMAFYKVPSHEG